MVEHLLSMCKALSLNPTSRNNQINKILSFCCQFKQLHALLLLPLYLSGVSKWTSWSWFCFFLQHQDMLASILPVLGSQAYTTVYNSYMGAKYSKSSPRCSQNPSSYPLGCLPIIIFNRLFLTLLHSTMPA